MISQMKNQFDVVDKVIAVKYKGGQKLDNQQSFINSILRSIAFTPTSDNKSKCSSKQYADIIPKTSRYRSFREASIKNYLIIHMHMVLY